ncbi:uncharacterized protein LOC121240839 [Juglans microcarpa x Juglans regia]|uniref:uncharacterized protein LOC121240839 n=1 Tax=Juglans microcarpa x Juglans regia TaxID=2249226 RepID=UPI001B7E39EC|nr:uncharacterized protein LOC121240839 [Juglans microcarpa x Juglans regia]
MTHGRIPRNPKGATNKENQNFPMDGGLAEAVRLLTGVLRQQQQQQAHLLIWELGTLAALTWEWFNEEFNSRFFPDSVKQLKAQEFVTLTRGSLTVELYAAKFMVLGRFAPHLISTQRMQVQKFQAGLKPRIRSQVASLRIENYQELVNVAAIVEVEQRGLVIQINIERKRTSLYTTEESSERKKLFTGSDKGKCIEIGSSIPITFPPCGECGKHHGGKWRIALGTCFRCGQLSHMIKDYPSVALRNERKGVSLNSGCKPKPTQHVPMRVYAVT